MTLNHHNKTGQAEGTSGSGVPAFRRPTWVLIDGWAHIRPSECEMRYLIPRQQGNSGWLEQPYGELRLGGELDVLINGRKVLWSLLDALFPDDPLPRKLFNQIVKEDGVQARDDINSFLQESTTASLSIQIGESPDPTTRSRLTFPGPAAQLIVPSTVEGVSEAQEVASMFEGTVYPATWVDRNGSHLTTCVLIPAGKGWVQVVDVGSKFVVSGQYRTQWGVVRPLRADAVVKSLGWPLVLHERVGAHQDAVTDAPKGLVFPPVEPVMSDISSEMMQQQHELFLEGWVFD